MKQFIQKFVLIAFVLAGISPACQFVSGKSIFEICSLDGVVETKIDPALLAYLPEDYKPKQPPREGKHALPDCNFCAAQSHVKLAGVDVVSILTPDYVPVSRVSTHSTPVGEGIEYLRPSPRGPPALFV